MAPEALDPWKDPAKRKLCTACRAKVVMILGPNGKYIPVQKVTQTYVLQMDLSGIEPRLRRHHEGEVWISHFQTCPDAASFSKRQKKGSPA